jgi:hypothetical protein
MLARAWQQVPVQLQQLREQGRREPLPRQALPELQALQA